MMRFLLPFDWELLLHYDESWTLAGYEPQVILGSNPYELAELGDKHVKAEYGIKRWEVRRVIDETDEEEAVHSIHSTIEARGGRFDHHV